MSKNERKRFIRDIMQKYRNDPDEKRFNEEVRNLLNNEDGKKKVFEDYDLSAVEKAVLADAILGGWIYLRRNQFSNSSQTYYLMG